MQGQNIYVWEATNEMNEFPVSYGPLLPTQKWES